MFGQVGVSFEAVPLTTTPKRSVRGRTGIVLSYTDGGRAVTGNLTIHHRALLRFSDLHSWLHVLTHFDTLFLEVLT
jgi:hypothetical protein